MPLTPHNVHFASHWVVIRARKRLRSSGIIHWYDAIEINLVCHVVKEIAHLKSSVSDFGFLGLITLERERGKVIHTGRGCQRDPPGSNQHKWPPRDVVSRIVLGF